MLSPREMAAEICNADSNGESANLYALYRPYLRGSQFILASDKGATPGATINRDFEHTAVVRGLFNSEKIVVLDETTFFELLNGKATYSYDQSVALDTMAHSYPEPYIENRTSRVPKDFAEVFGFIADDSVNVVHENLSNLSTLGASKLITDVIKAQQADETFVDEAVDWSQQNIEEWRRSM